MVGTGEELALTYDLSLTPTPQSKRVFKRARISRNLSHAIYAHAAACRRGGGGIYIYIYVYYVYIWCVFSSHFTVLSTRRHHGKALEWCHTTQKEKTRVFNITSECNVKKHIYLNVNRIKQRLRRRTFCTGTNSFFLLLLY